MFALQLLDQMEGSGPPPADARQIESLPTVKISQDDVGTLSKILTCFTRSKRERDCSVEKKMVAASKPYVVPSMIFCFRCKFRMPCL